MKKITIILSFTLLILSSSCKNEIDSLFVNPDGATVAKIEYLFTKAIAADGAELREGYNPAGYYLILQGIGPWIQIVANNANSASMMSMVSNMVGNSWTAYYQRFMSKVFEMQMLYDKLPEKEKSDYDIYMNLIKIVKANATSKITDLYGDIPYFEASKARLPKEKRILFPKFDSQQKIYTAILADLKAASTFLSSFSLNDSFAHKSLPKQDLLNSGEIDKWLKFCNSLRLRIAMRISDVDPALAKATVKEVENSPLVLTNADNILVEAKSPNGLNTKRGSNGQNFIGRAFFDRKNRTFAGEIMVDLMNKANDPRMPYYFTKNESNVYIGVPSSPEKLAVISDDVKKENYSKISEELVLENENLPGIVITAAEVNFLLAEAAMKGFTGGSAENFYNTALRASVEFYYQLVLLNKEASPKKPVAADVDAFVNTSTFKFDGTIEQLATQKWINFGVLQAKEAYADYRRFDYPTLQDNIPKSGGAVLVIPTKIPIPDREKSFNEENYATIKANDTPTSKVWWDTK